MNNKNIIRNKTNKLGMIAVIAAAAMIAIAPAITGGAYSIEHGCTGPPPDFWKKNDDYMGENGVKGDTCDIHSNLPSIEVYNKKLEKLDPDATKSTINLDLFNSIKMKETSKKSGDDGVAVLNNLRGQSDSETEEEEEIEMPDEIVIGCPEGKDDGKGNCPESPPVA